MGRWNIAAICVSLISGAAIAIACGDGGDEDAHSATATPPPTSVSFAPAGPSDFSVIAGAAEGAFDIEQFMPATVRIRAGDTIVWKGSGHEGHTVTFIPSGKTFEDVGLVPYLAPAPDMPDALEFNPNLSLASVAQGSYDGSTYTNSGFFGVPAEGEYRLTFPTAGVFPYLCMVHPLNMRGVVVVDEAAAEVPDSKAVADEGRRQLVRYIAEAREAADASRAERRAASEASGGTSWEVSVGLDTPRGQVLAFLPGSLDIQAGDKVTFWNSERDFHNIIFAPEGMEPPAFPIIKPAPAGRTPYRVLINPDAFDEVPPPRDFGPDDYFSSGMLGISLSRLYYEVTFTNPGTYRFVCTVHASAGMAGVINVR